MQFVYNILQRVKIFYLPAPGTSPTIGQQRRSVGQRAAAFRRSLIIYTLEIEPSKKANVLAAQKLLSLGVIKQFRVHNGRLRGYRGATWTTDNCLLDGLL